MGMAAVRSAVAISENSLPAQVQQLERRGLTGLVRAGEPISKLR